MRHEDWRRVATRSDTFLCGVPFCHHPRGNAIDLDMGLGPKAVRKAGEMRVKQRLEKLERKTSLLRVVVAPPGDDIEKLRARLEAESRGPVVVLEADCERL
jgi:hypothetical protein